jgi:hypothetical protein
MEHLPSFKERLVASFSIIDDIVAAAHEAALDIRYSSDEALEVDFEMKVFERAINGLKAVRLLCENGHWEFGVSAVRLLFELVLNLEEVDRAPKRVVAIQRYIEFAMLQGVRQTLAQQEYDKKSGRSGSEERLTEGRALLDAPMFRKFRVPRRKDTWVWADSWSGKTIRKLAEDSPSPLRQDQYRLLYSAWSEQTHGAPSAILLSSIRGPQTARAVMDGDDVRISEAVGSAVTHFLEVWLLMKTIPPPTLEQLEGWFKRMLDEAYRFGATAKPSGAEGESPFGAPHILSSD